MRDPKRIDRILRRLKAYWKANPDLRLGQIVVNAASDPKRSTERNTYYIEDDEIEAGIPEVGDAQG